MSFVRLAVVLVIVIVMRAEFVYVHFVDTDEMAVAAAVVLGNAGQGQRRLAAVDS